MEIDKSSFQVCRSFSSQSQDTPQSTATPTENSMDLFTLRDSQDTTESAEQEAEAFSLWKKHEMAIMVDTAEWKALSSGQASAILRSCSTIHEAFVVLLKNNQMHWDAVGIVALSQQPVTLAKGQELAADARLGGVYTAKDIRQRKGKCCLWEFSEVSAFANPSTVMLSTKIPGNRPFQVPLHRLRYTVPPPTRADLSDTCRFFLQSMTPSDRDTVMRLGDSLRGKSVPVGTTCSGSDICISVLRRILDTISGEATNCIQISMQPVPFCLVFVRQGGNLGF